MFGRLTGAALAVLLSSHAFAYDASRANRYPSPDMYRPNVDSIILRGTGSQGPADGFSVTLPSGGQINLGALANPLSSPLVSKFRKISATYEDFASAGDGKPWTQSADVCPAINAATAYLIGAGGGTLDLPPAVANCATPLRGSNLSFVQIRGQGVGAFSQSGTELKWTGAAGAIMLDLRATTPQVPVSGVRISGLVLNGNGLAKTGLYIRGLKYSNIEMLVRETVGPGVDIDIDEARGPLATGTLTGQIWAKYTVGTNGADGTYTNVPLVSAAGAPSGGATADVTIANGSVSNIVIKTGGHDYVLNETLSIPSASIGGTTGVTIQVGNCGNASTSFLDTSQTFYNLRVTQQGPASVNAKGVLIGPGSPWLDTNSSTFSNILTLTQNGTGLEVGNADTVEFPFVRVGNAEAGNTGGIVDLKAGIWQSPSSARVLRFGTVTATQGLYARGGQNQPSTRNIVEKYNFESGEGPPVIENGALINMKDDRGNPIGNDGFTVNLVRSTYTPTMSRAGTAQTSATSSADYRRYGREIFDLRMDLSVLGGSGVVKASLPCNPYRDTVFFGFDRANSQTMVQGRVGAQDPTVYFYMMDGSQPPTNFQPIVRGALECSQF